MKFALLFILFLGFNFVSAQSALEQVLQLTNRQKLRELADLYNRLSDDALNIHESNALIEGYNNYLSCFKIMMLANCGFVHYDVQENSLLGNLIDRADSLKFEIK